MAGTVLGFGKTELKSPCPNETHIPLGKTENKMYIKKMISNCSTSKPYEENKSSNGVEAG